MNRQTTIFTLLLLATLPLAACAPIAVPRSAESTPVPFTTVVQGAPLGDQPAGPLYTVATEAGQWQELRDRIPSEAADAGADSIRSDQILILAFGGVKGSSGYQIDIEQVVREGDQLVITVSEMSPDPDQVVEPATTLPFHLAAISPADVDTSRISTVVFQDTEHTILNQESLANH